MQIKNKFMNDNIDPTVNVAVNSIFASANVTRHRAHTVGTARIVWMDDHERPCGYVSDSDCYATAACSPYYQIIRVGFVGRMTAADVRSAWLQTIVTELACGMLRVRVFDPEMDRAEEYTISVPDVVWIDYTRLVTGSTKESAKRSAKESLTFDLFTDFALFHQLPSPTAVTECSFHRCLSNEPIAVIHGARTIPSIDVLSTYPAQCPIMNRPILFTYKGAIITLGKVTRQEQTISVVVPHEADVWAVVVPERRPENVQTTPEFACEVIAAAVNAGVPLLRDWYERQVGKAIMRGSWDDVRLSTIVQKVIRTHAFANHHFTRTEIDRAMVQYLYPDEHARIAPVSAATMSDVIRPWARAYVAHRVRRQMIDPRNLDAVVGHPTIYRMRADPWAGHPNRAELWKIVMPASGYLSLGAYVYIAPTTSIDDVLIALDAKRGHITTQLAV